MAVPTPQGNDVTTRYTPFRALLGLCLAVAVLQGLQVIDALADLRQIRDARRQLAPNLKQALTVNQTMEALGHDLRVLAGTSPCAAGLIVEFGLQEPRP